MKNLDLRAVFVIHTGASQFLIARERQVFKAGLLPQDGVWLVFIRLSGFCPDLTLTQKLEDFLTRYDPVFQEVFRLIDTPRP